MSAAIPLFDLSRQERLLRKQREQIVAGVLRRGRYILGPEVDHFEQRFSRFCGVRHAVGVGSGTDALELALRGLGIGPGDLVATVSFTFLATVDAILHVGAQPLFVDIDPATCTMCPGDLEWRIKTLPEQPRRRVKAVIPVHLYGHPADMSAIGRVARKYGLRVIEDAAQAAGARWAGRPVGGQSDAGCFSFFPTKPLGGFGDGGAVVTRSAALANKLRMLRVHGRHPSGGQRLLGRNSRLDTLQAALLDHQLGYLADWNRKRRALAARYRGGLSDLPEVQLLHERPGADAVYALYVIRAKRRRALQAWLREQGVGSQVYYPGPVHLEPLHRRQFSKLELPHTRQACREVLALPMFPELKHAEVDRVCRSVRSFYRNVS